MEKNVKHIIREVDPEHCSFSLYFDCDGLTGTGGDYCYNLFIIDDARKLSGFNSEEYANIQEEIEDLLEIYEDIVNESMYAEYPSLAEMLVDFNLIDNINNTKRVKKFSDFFKNCSDTHSTERTADYLTLKTGKEWKVESAYGYCQGDYVEIVYCPEHYTGGVKHYGEIWLGAAKEFCTIELDENGEEVDACYGYIVADCQAFKDEDYKKLVCEWAGLDEADTRLELIDGSKTYTVYKYRTV